MNGSFRAICYPASSRGYFFTFEIIGKTFVVTRSGSLSFKRAERYEVKFIEADAKDNFWGGLGVLGRAPPQ
jgi:hypothetical protein